MLRQIIQKNEENEENVRGYETSKSVCDRIDHEQRDLDIWL